MSDTPIVVPGDQTTVDKRRFRVIPLTYPENADRAGFGEILVDDDIGDFYVKAPDGSLISRTANIEQLIHDEMENNINQMSYQYNRNRRVYRLFFTSEYVRLDANLILDNSCAYYRVRDIADSGKYYVTTLTDIKSRALLANTMVDNEMYFVEFYNKKKEQISCLPFSAKAALYFDNSESESEVVTHIYITTNKDIAYVGENPSSLICRCIAVYDDGTEKDITNYSTVDIDTSGIDWNTVGVYKIKATYVYDMENVLSLTAEKNFEISDDKSVTISDVIVVPRKIINLNDGSREIRLTVIVYYADGSAKDVSDECIISAFNPVLFNVEQTIVVKLNAGTVNVFEDTYVIKVDDSGAASDYVLNFNEDHILKLDDTTRTEYPDGALFFKVRDAENISVFYTPVYNEIHYNALFVDDAEHTISENKNVIVEFYGSDYQIIDSDVYVCKYKSSET